MCEFENLYDTVDTSSSMDASIQIKYPGRWKSSRYARGRINEFPRHLLDIRCGVVAPVSVNDLWFRLNAFGRKPAV